MGGRFIKTSILEYLNTNISKREFDNILYGENHHIFSDKVRSYHGRIESGLIVRFYLREYLRYYEANSLDSVGSWDEFTQLIYQAWDSRKPSPISEIVFRRGDLTDAEMFFSSNINVASVYSGPLNAYYLDFENPYILDCEESDWMTIAEPEIMRGISFDGEVSTDNVVEFIKKRGEHDGVVFRNIYEGSGADVFGPSNIYVSLNASTVTLISDNQDTIL